MSVFAVTYSYSASEAELAEIRPTHRAFFKELLEQQTLLASGPMVDRPGALLIVRADSVEQVAEILDQDPFDIAGYIGERAIAEWNPVFGPWSAA
ncbi:MAG: hypothetical protein RIR46_878 [Actinomycetota bacterium]|jgi:uncharacterized protein YciI